MPVFKNEKSGTWYVMAWYRDWTGERSFQMQTSADLNMTFDAFTELYTKDVKPRLKENTWLNKENIIQKKILPYFGKRKISKSYQRLHGEDVITTPKTKKSNRIIKMSNFLCDEMKDYLGMLYGVKKKERVFTITKSYLHHEMDRGAKAAGVKRIRIHDLRHSHISLLIDMGFSAVAIADRVGHESIEITYRYAHLMAAS